MTVCVCYQIDRETLETLASEGAGLERVIEATGVTTSCGLCREDVGRILGEGAAGQGTDETTRCRAASIARPAGGAPSPAYGFAQGDGLWCHRIRP